MDSVPALSEPKAVMQPAVAKSAVQSLKGCRENREGDRI